MSTLLTCRDLSYGAGTKTLFRGLSASIAQGDKVGLNGHNGSGKSTLLRLLAGEVEPDGGEVVRRQGLALSVVEQFLPDGLAGQTLHAAVASRLPEISRETEGYRAARILDAVGFTEPDQKLTVSALSGGQLNRLMLARALVTEPELILFDEPSNHMDLATLASLERFLADEIDCAFLLVSHDRALLDAVTNRTLILRDEQLYAFDLPYSAAREKLTEMDIAAAAARADEEKKIAALRASAKRLAIWGRVYDNEKLARKAKSMEKRVARLEQARTFVSRGSGLSLSLESSGARSNRMLRVVGLTVTPPGAPDHVLFRIDELTIRPGERIALLGHNGCGKTSLLIELIAALGAAPGGPVQFSPQARVGYYDQELNEVLRGGPDETMVGYLRRSTEAQEAAIRSGLINAGFAYRDHDRRVSVLSGGERARLMFLALRLDRPNFLIMDEPTNHIDIDGREELEAQLAEADATLLMTSHDRRFIDNVATRFLLVGGGRLREIQDPEPFYESAATDDGSGSSRATGRADGDAGSIDRARSDATGPTSGTAADAGRSRDFEAEGILERIVELEALLEADLARKPKFQKPKLQRAWREELKELNRRLDAGD